MKNKTKFIALILLLGGLVAYLYATTEPSDWRYPKLLITQLPKMPFRYFV